MTIRMLRVPEARIVYSQEPEKPMEYTKRLDKGYSRFARAYDLSVKLLPVWKTWIKTTLPYIQGPRVLEASFGTGYLMMHYADDYETYGVDLNARMIELTKENLSGQRIKANLARADVEQLPFPDACFDTIVNTMSFSGYPSGVRAMSEFYRVLKKRGVLLMVDFAYPSDRNRLGYWLTKWMEKAGDTIRDVPEILRAFPFEYREEEIGGFGAVHLYVARKLENASMR